MDEMTLLREFRAGTPPITAEAARDARHRLLADAADPGERGHRLARTRWRLGAAVILTVAATAVVAIGLNGAEGGAPQPPRLATVATVAELGDRAARAAESGPVPGRDQWVYIKGSRAVSPDGDHPGITDRRTVWEVWLNCGKPCKVATSTPDGKLNVRNRSSSLSLGRYSTDPDVLLGQLQATARKRQPAGEHGSWSPQEEMFVVIRSLMAQTAPPPKLQAALYRVLPRIKGVTLRKDAVDAAGRHGVAFAMTAHSGGDRQEIILDPATYRFLGTRAVALRSFTVPNIAPRGENSYTRIPAGTVLYLTAQLAQVIVDKPGQRP